MDARCTLKTESGTTRRINIKKNSDPRICVGQPILHTSMDNLGQMSYEDEKLLYRYKGIVAVPSICMVDDIWSIQRSQVNAVISAFIEILKNLNLVKRNAKEYMLYIYWKINNNDHFEMLYIHILYIFEVLSY